ncbi:hypothetical protein DZF93_18765, partial [Clavibacter michiganensis subsp. insidiosus]
AAIMAGVAAGPATGTMSAAAAAATRRNLTRSIKDVEHVVILMQENRSFDHYYGTFPGVRGFSDRQAVEHPGGGSVFAQPDATRTDGGHLLPFPLDSANHNAQGAGSLNHSWKGGHAAWNEGAWDNWVVAKRSRTTTPAGPVGPAGVVVQRGRIRRGRGPSRGAPRRRP